jgi:hypothetical protein
VLARYRTLETRLAAVAADDLAGLEGMLRPTPLP